MKKLFLGLVFLLAFVALQAPAVFAQGCSVTGISLASSAANSSTCFVPAGQGLAYAVTGTWAGTGNLYRSDNGGVSYISIVSFTANVSGVIPAGSFTANALYRVTFDSRTSGTMTGTLLGLNPLPGRRIFETVPIGLVAYGSFGNNTTLVNGTHYCSDVNVTRAMTVTSIDVLNGATVGTDNHLVELYDGSGQLLGNSAVAGAVTSGANAFQDRVLLSNVSIQPGLYFMCAQSNGTTDTLRMQTTSTFVATETTSVAGTFGTVPTTLTVPTTFTTNVGPIGYLKGF